jgi:hypothetical protein
MKPVTIDFDIPKAAKDIEEIIDSQSYDFVNTVARLTQYEIKAHIPPPENAWRSNTNGSLATGDLKDSIKYTINKVGDTYHAEIGPEGDAHILMKARVHAYGKKVRARKKPYMRIWLPSGWVTLKEYTITPKGFMLVGFSKARRLIARYT